MALKIFCTCMLVPPIMIASFALQESSCNPNTVGGAGEQGLMQLTKDKCGDAPGGNCKDPVSFPSSVAGTCLVIFFRITISVLARNSSQIPSTKMAAASSWPLDNIMVGDWALLMHVFSIYVHNVHLLSNSLG